MKISGGSGGKSTSLEGTLPNLPAGFHCKAGVPFVKINQGSPLVLRRFNVKAIVPERQ
jgi:hypothetical protein